MAHAVYGVLAAPADRAEQQIIDDLALPEEVDLPVTGHR